MVPSLDVIKIIAFEAEPVIDRVHYTYTLVFSADKSNVRWKVTHQFSRFKILNLLIRKLAPKLIYSKFPKDSTTTLLGLRVSKKAVDNRRLMLDIWIREVVANYEIFPEEIVQSLSDFIKAPKKIITVLDKKFSSSNDENPATHTILRRTSSFSHLTAAISLDAKNFKDFQPVTAPKKKQRFEIIIRSIARLCSKIVYVLTALFDTDWQGTATVCISRTEKLIMKNGDNFPGIFLRELFENLTCYCQIFIITYILNNIVGLLLFMWGDFNFSSTAVLLGASIAMYSHLLKSDYVKNDEDGTSYNSSHLTVQNTLRKFLNSPSLEYVDKVYSFPSFLAYRDINSPSSKSDSDEESYSSDDLAEILSYEDSPNKQRDDNHRSNSSPFFLRNSDDGNAFLGVNCEESKGHFGSNFMVNGVTDKYDPPVLHESLVPGSTYDNVEFKDLCTEARAMYSDRSLTHAMKVIFTYYMLLFS